MKSYPKTISSSIFRPIYIQNVIGLVIIVFLLNHIWLDILSRNNQSDYLYVPLTS